MSISFSGLASGLDTSSWIESLVALKRAKVTALQEEKETVLLSKDTLNSIKTFFASFRSTIEKITDSKFNIVSMDLFAQNLATSANLSVLTASATTEAEEGTYNVKVDKLASKTNATSNYKYTTTIVETTTATNESFLKNLGVTAGTVGVTVNGIKHGVAITESDTIATFIEKLQKIGVEASFNESTGVFSMNVGEVDIDDTIDNTGIVNALHLEGVNEGYKTVDRLEIQKVETEWTPADSGTLLKDLGVSAGTIEISANNAIYDITIDDTTTLGEFVTALRDNDIDANLSSAGIFTLLDASITNEGSTNIIDAMGLQTDIYSKTQATGALTHQTITTETTTATSATLLKDIGEGTAISDGQTVIVKNSNNVYTTIDVGESTTIGELLAEMSNAGLSASIDSNGIVKISGGTITGGTFDAVSALGLETEPYTAMVTGNSLTETIVEHEIVNMDTRLVDDMGVTEGYLEIADADGNTFYEKIYSGQTIGDLMADLANLGIYSTLDEENGILEITGGAFTTLTDADVQALVASNTIAEPDARYQKGTNLLECLYGAGTISTDHIEVASAYSRTRALTYSTTNLVNATLDTTLGTLGLTDGTAIFDVRNEEVTINVTSDMTVQGLIDELSANGIEATWDEDFSRLTINNTTLTGGSSNLADVLNLSTEVAGKYVTSDALNAQSTITVDATGETTLGKLGVNTTESVVLHKEDGTTYTFSVDGTTSLDSLLSTLNSNGVTAKLENGILSIEGGYLENATLETALGLSSSVLGYSNILGNKVTHTVTTTATGDTTLGNIITALGAESAVSGGYSLSFNSSDLSVNANTTLDDLLYQIHTKGGSASIDSAGRLHIEGGTVSGSVATALGISSVTTTSAVGATGEILETITTINADSTTKLSALGLGTSTITISKDDGVEVGTITTNADMTIGDLFSALAGYGISGTINNGVISLDSNNGHYATGGVLDSMGIGTTSSTYTTTAGMTVTSKSPVTYTSTIYTTTFPTVTQTVNTTHTIVVTSPTVGTQTITVTDTIVTTEPVIGTSTLYVTETISSTHTLNVVKTVTVNATDTLTIDATSTMTIDVIATEDTTFAELGILSASDPTANIYAERYDSAGNKVKEDILGQIHADDSIADYLSIINSNTEFNLTATFKNGVITVVDDTDDGYSDVLSEVDFIGYQYNIGTVTTTITISGIATEDTTFKELGINVSDWNLYGYRFDPSTGSENTANNISFGEFNEDSTLKDLLDSINNSVFGPGYSTATLVNGVITIQDNPDVPYVVIYNGELAEALGIEIERTAAVTSTATEDTTFAELGINVSDWTLYSTLYDNSGNPLPGVAPTAHQVFNENNSIGDFVDYINTHLSNVYGASFENGIITIENRNSTAALTGELAEALGIEIERTAAVTSTATEDTTFAELGINVSDWNLYSQGYLKETGEIIAENSNIGEFTENSTLEEFLSVINNTTVDGIKIYEATLNNGVINVTSIAPAYANRTWVLNGELAEALGIQITTSTVQRETTATSDTTFAELGITNDVIDSWDVYIERYSTSDGSDAGAVGLDTFDENTTLGEFISIINNTTLSDFAAQLYNGVITINDATPDDGYDYILTGDLIEALGIQTTTTTVSATTTTANRNTTFAELGINVSDWGVYQRVYIVDIGSYAESTCLHTFSAGTTLGEFVDLINNDTVYFSNYTAMLEDGVITIDNNGTRGAVIGELAKALGIDISVSGITTVATPITSSVAITYTGTIYTTTTMRTTITSTAAVTYTTLGTPTFGNYQTFSDNPLNSLNYASIDQNGAIIGTGDTDGSGYTYVAINTVADLVAMNGKLYEGYHFVLTNDMELGHASWEGISLSNSVFDGNGHILQLSITIKGGGRTVMGVIAAGAEGYGFISAMYGTTVKDLYVDGGITFSDTSNYASTSEIAGFGLIGACYNSTINGVVSGAEITVDTLPTLARSDVGGIVGTAEMSTISNVRYAGCFRTYNVTYAGGICGYAGTSLNLFNVISMPSTLGVGTNTVLGGIIGYCGNISQINAAYVGGAWAEERQEGLFIGYDANNRASSYQNQMYSNYDGYVVGSGGITHTARTVTLSPYMQDLINVTGKSDVVEVYDTYGNLSGFIRVGANITLDSFVTALGSNIEDDGTFSFEGSLAGASAALSQYGLSQDVSYNDWNTDILGSIPATATVTVTASGSTTLETIFNGNGMSSVLSAYGDTFMSFLVTNASGTNVATISISKTSTIDSLNEALGEYGTMSINSYGIVTLEAAEGYSIGLGHNGTSVLVAFFEALNLGFSSMSASTSVDVTSTEATITATGSTTLGTILEGNGLTAASNLGTISVYTTDGTKISDITLTPDTTADSLNSALGSAATASIGTLGTAGMLSIKPNEGYFVKLDTTNDVMNVLNLMSTGGFTASTNGSVLVSNTESDLLQITIDGSVTTSNTDSDKLKTTITVAGIINTDSELLFYTVSPASTSNTPSELLFYTVSPASTSNTPSELLFYTVSSTTTSNTSSDAITVQTIIETGTTATVTVNTTGTVTITVQETMTSDQTVVHTIVTENTTTQLVTHTVTATFTVENTTTEPVTMTVVGTATIELPTVSVTATETTVQLNYDTNLWDLIEQNVGVLYDAPVFKIEGIPKLTITSSTTFGEYAAELAKYDIEMFVDSEGKVTVKNNGNSLITDFGSAFVIDDAIEKDVIAEALNIKSGNGNTFTITVHTTYDNTDSNTLLQTVTAAATGATELQYLRNDSGTAPSGYELVLSTTSNAGNEFLTITFSATSTVYDVIDELAQHGLAATIDSLGRFSVNSTTLTDFDISGDLGTFLMGSYTKVYDEGQINSVSTNLIQQTVVNMDDSTLMSKIGITNGNLIILKDGSNYTISIDSSKTIGEFRAQLAELGLTSSIVDGRLQVSHNGELSFAEAPTDASNVITVLGLGNSTGGSDSENYSQTSKHLYDTQGSSGAASMSNKISELTDSSGNNLGITAGQIYVYQDGSRNTLNIDPNDTLQDLANKLSQYGITMGIGSDGKLYFDGNNNSYMTTDGIVSGSASNILTKFNILNNWSTRYNSISETLDYEEQENAKVNGSTKLVDLQDADGNSLGITEGNYYVYQNGVRTTESIGADTTVDDFVSTLATYGMTASFDETGALSVGGYNETYLATSATSGDDTNAIDVLFEQWNFTNIYTSNNLDIPTDVTVAISEATKLADINEGAYQAGYITVIKDGVKTDIELTADDTVGDLMDELALYGFESVINGNGQLIIQNTGDSLLQAYSGPFQASNALELLGIGLDDWINTNTYESSTVSVVTTTTGDVSSTRDTLLSEMGVTTGEYYIWKDGVKYTAFISSDETLGSLMETLEGFGIATSLVNNGSGSVLSIEGSGDCYIAKSANITNASNIVEQLFTAPSGEKYIHSGLQQTSEFVTTYSAATEDTLLSYFDEGVLTAEGDLSITIDGFTSTVLIEPNETIGSLLSKFRAQGLEATLNDGHIVIQSGYKEFTINTDGTTSSMPATLNLVFDDDLGGYVASNDTVTQTTTTIEERTVSVANYADYNTKMSLLNIANGTLTLYRDGEKATLNIDSNQTFGDLRAQISGRFADVDIKFEDGILTFFSTTEGVSVEVGATTDTSNFAAITGIQTTGEGTVKSARELYCANSSSIITTAGLFRNGDVKAGTFKIGDAEFTITDTTSLSALISQINASQSANATAYWDSVDGKLVIQSRTTGAALVNIEAGTSNFTDIMGFTKSEWADVDGDGDPDIGESLAAVTKMNVSAQEVGDNARFSINGTYYTSTSNTIGSDVSRIKGVTINLKGISEGETTLTIERDKESIANAVSDVVDAYNDLIENVDKEIAKGSPLDDQFTLKLLRNQIRSLMTSSIGGTGVFKNLDAVGISLNAATAGDIRTDNINTLNFDKDKFLDAFDADRDALKDLLVGTDANLGIFQRVENLVENAVTASYGYFQSAENSYNKQITRIDDKIKRAQTALERYRERLEAKFQSMDLLISQMQNQYSSFLAG